ncbi:MAG: hypothetical protein BWX84_02542 [Verrucomicrobia bacterium ADurb.Bin118]|nr:MAG: hypothetical protein BWX84_02542 [Verrucomicrobia bacterium ADurb.Bin118]
MRITAASLPGITTMSPLSWGSNWRYAQFLEAMLGQASNLFKSAAGFCVSDTPSTRKARTAAKYPGSVAGR